MLNQANNDLPDENLDIADIFKVLKILHLLFSMGGRFFNFFLLQIFKVVQMFHCQSTKDLKNPEIFKVQKIFILHLKYFFTACSNTNVINDIQTNYEKFLIGMGVGRSSFFTTTTVLKKLRKVFDRNGDGLISGEELKLTMCSLGETLTEDEV